MNVDLRGMRVLLLQGPNGPFFSRLHDELVEAGAEVRKLHLNAAEAWYYGSRPAESFRGQLGDWPAFLDASLTREPADLCFYFGDQRPYHVEARPMLERHGVHLFVFEEGYLRPDYVTVEEGGVNYRSPLRQLGKTAHQIVREMKATPLPPLPPLLSVEGAFSRAVAHTMAYSLGLTFGQADYPYYAHHRDLHLVRQTLLWARSFVRHAVFGLQERTADEQLRGPWRKQYFLVALQVHNDSQVRCSRFRDVRDFIFEVLESFARSAPEGVRLVFKHHPGDRAYRNYRSLLEEQAARLGIGERVLYVHDLHLPTLLQGALGTVLINSTVGWSSLHHGTPVHACCVSSYGDLGLAHEGTLDEFWSERGRVPVRVVRQIQLWLRATSQANGSVWIALPGAGPTGFRWPPRFEARLRELAAAARHSHASPRAPG